MPQTAAPLTFLTRHKIITTTKLKKRFNGLGINQFFNKSGKLSELSLNRTTDVLARLFHK